MTFRFKTVPDIIFETGAASRLGAIARPLMARPLIVTDKGLLDSGLLEPALFSLRTSGATPVIFSDVRADPPEETVLAAVSTARLAAADGVIAIGGGSSMDTAKIAAVLLHSSQTLNDIYGVDRVKGGRAPLILVPTTAGTGSEVTDISVVTLVDGQKMGVVARQLFPDIAVLDANLTVSLPRSVTAATGVDAMTHAIEAYTSRLRKNPLSDVLAKEALRLLARHIVRACETPGDIAAREGMLLGSMLAGQAFANAPVGAVHAMAYPLGGVFHVPHGLSNALMLGPVLSFNAETTPAPYAELAQALGLPAERTEAEMARSFIRHLDDICTATGIERRLSQVGVSHNDVPRMAEDVMKIERLLKNNPRELTYDDAVRLYSEVL